MTRKTAIRAESFERFLKANLDKSTRRDIASHGADAGWPWLTWTSDTVRLFDKYADEIWTLAFDEAESMGEPVLGMIASFGRSDMADTIDGFKNLMVWFAAEEYCRRENPDD